MQLVVRQSGGCASSAIWGLVQLVVRQSVGCASSAI